MLRKETFQPLRFTLLFTDAKNKAKMNSAIDIGRKTK